MGGMDRNADGTRVMTASRLEDLQHRYGLNPAEAEEVFTRREAGDDEGQAVDQVKNARRVFRAHTERTYSPESDPRLIPERKRQEDEQRLAAEADKHAPESGLYGRPPYTEATETAGTVTRASDLPR